MNRNNNTGGVSFPLTWADSPLWLAPLVPVPVPRSRGSSRLRDRSQVYLSLSSSLVLVRLSKDEKGSPLKSTSAERCVSGKGVTRWPSLVPPVEPRMMGPATWHGGTSRRRRARGEAASGHSLRGGPSFSAPRRTDNFGRIPASQQPKWSVGLKNSNFFVNPKRASWRSVRNDRARCAPNWWRNHSPVAIPQHHGAPVICLWPLPRIVGASQRGYLVSANDRGSRRPLHKRVQYPSNG